MSRSGKVEINQVTKMVKMRKVEKIVSKTQSKIDPKFGISSDAIYIGKLNAPEKYFISSALI